MKSRKIAFVLPSFAGGGAERVMLHFLHSLNPEHYQVVLIVLNGEGPLRSSLSQSVRLIDLRASRLRIALLRLRRCISQEKPDVLVSTMGYLNLAVLGVCATLSQPPSVIVREANTVHSTLSRLPYGIGKLAYQLLYPRANFVICNARHVAKELEALCPHLRRPVELIVNPIDEAGIRLQAGQPISVELSKGWFVAIGRLTPAKGFDRLLGLLSSSPPQVKVLFIGDGPERSRLESLAERLTVSDQVRFIGFQANPWSILARSRGLIMMSRWEGLPNVALEALACGVPVYGLESVDGLDEIQEKTQQGAVVLAPNSQALAHFLSTSSNSVSKSDELAASLLPAAFESAVVRQQFITLLEKALHERHGRAESE
jgi:glycosyltransferase involved in cell wall biosynthesis